MTAPVRRIPAGFRPAERSDVRTDDIFINAIGSDVPELVATPRPGIDTVSAAAVAGATPAVDLALAAGRTAVERWGGRPADIGLLLYVDVYHTGPDGWCPQSYLQRHLIGGQPLAAGIRQGCNGVFGALELSAAYLRALPESAAALVVAADNFDSPLLDRWTTLEGYCMSDGASAVVLSRRPGFARLRSVTSTSVPELENLHRGDEPLHPAGVLAGRRLSFQERMETALGGAALSPHLAALWIKTLEETVYRALDEAGVAMAGIRRAAFPHGPLAAVEVNLLPLGLTREQSTWDFGRTVGHSANDQVLSLEHLLDRGEVDPGDHVLMVGVGPGVGFAAAVVEIVERPAWAGARYRR